MAARAPADVERQSYDAAGQLVSVSRNDGGHWVSQTHQYTSSGRMSVVTLPNGLQAWFYYYDLLGRRIGHRSPDTGLTPYLLDACGNERLRTIATGQQVRTEVDAMNRVTGVYYDAEPSPRVSYSYYDQGAAVPGDGVTANRAGRVWRVTDELGTVTLHDALAYAPGTHQLSSVAGSPVSFDAAGRMSAARFGQLTFDPAGHLSQVRSPQGQLTSHVYGYTGARVSTVAADTQTYLAPSDNWTGGASLVALGVLTANLSTAMLVGVSIGALGGAIAGELAAQKAGGNIWAGAFMGAVLGGVTSLAGGVLGGMVGGALKALPLLEYVVSGAVQGAVAGMGTGMAVGYAGGKGNAEQMFLHAATGALWDAPLGALLGLGTYFVAASPPPVSPGQQPGSPYLQIGSINQLNPAAAQTSAGLVGAVNNQLTLGNDIAEMATNASGANSAGLLADFVGTRYLADDASVFFSNGALVNIPLGWVPNAVLNGGAFAALVNVSFAADQAGFSFADQLTKILKMTPVGWLMTVFVEGNPGDDYNKAADGLNQFLGSADPNEYP